MKRDEEIGKTIFRIGQRISKIHMKNQTNAGLDQDTIMYGWIIGYIAKHEDEGIYQKNIEKKMGLHKSTVSTILTGLESKGYVKRLSVSQDARLKKLVLTEEGHKISKKIHQALNRADSAFSKGLTGEEQETLFYLLKKVEANISEMEETLNL